MKRIIIFAALLVLTACTDVKEAKRVLEENGYSQVQSEGYAWFACSKEDTFHTAFTAVAPTGRPVHGVVCSGWVFRASTIRF